MSVFSTIHQAGLDRAVLATHGETVTYSQDGGAAISCMAIVERDPIDTNATDRGNQPRRARRVRISKTDVDAVIVGADTVTLKIMADDATATTVRVGSILEDHGGAWLLDLGG